MSPSVHPTPKRLSLALIRPPIFRPRSLLKMAFMASEPYDLRAVIAVIALFDIPAFYMVHRRVGP